MGYTTHEFHCSLVQNDIRQDHFVRAESDSFRLAISI